jgi:hypothetical protein
MQHKGMYNLAFCIKILNLELNVLSTEMKTVNQRRLSDRGII